jgi:hypothetical protein
MTEGSAQGMARWFGIGVLAFVILLAAGGFYLLDQFFFGQQRELERRIAQQREQISRLEKDKLRLETYLKLLRYTERRARLEVLKLQKNEQGVPITTVRFTEVDSTGTPVTPSRDFTLTGEEIYIDSLVIKFEDHFVEQSDPLKGRSLLLFRRIFTSRMRPEEGYVLDRQGLPPDVYAREKAPNEFERELWAQFWELANNADLAKKHGVRAIHGDAPYTRVEPNRIYHIVLRSTGEISITPGTRLPAKDSR